MSVFLPNQDWGLSEVQLSWLMKKEVIPPAQLQGSTAAYAGGGCPHPGGGMSPGRGESRERGLRRRECGSWNTGSGAGFPHRTLCDVKTSKMASPNLTRFPWGWRCVLLEEFPKVHQ